MNIINYPTGIGNLSIRFENDTIFECNWCSNVDLAAENTPVTSADISFCKEITTYLDLFFKGIKTEHDFAIIGKGSYFQMNVWREISRIPYGQTITYKELARRCGNPQACRAVANACGANPVVLFIPCHRVVGSGGKLGGYTGGIEKKIFLLNLENYIFKAT